MENAIWAMYYNGEFCFAAKETPIVCPLYQMKLIEEKSMSVLGKDVFVLSCTEHTLYRWEDKPKELDLFECVIVSGKEKAARLQKALQSKEDAIVFDTSEKRIWTANGEQILAQLWNIPLLSSRYRIVFQEEVGENGFISMQDILSMLDKNKPVRGSVIDIYTDGATWRKIWFGGWAFAVYQDGKEICHKENVFPVHPAEVKYATIISEYTAVLHALDYVIETRPQKAVIHYDNDMVVTGGFCNVKDHVEAHFKYKECLKKKLDSLKKIGVVVSWQKVEAHIGNTGNERVDTLATEAVLLAEEYFLAGTTMDDWYNPHNLIYDKRRITPLILE